MKKTMLMVSLGVLVLLAGCSKGDVPTASATPAVAAPAAQTAYAQGSIKKGDKGHCVVCVVKEGSNKEESVVATLDYQGKTYVFCNEAEKAEFISSPAKYAAK